MGQILNDEVLEYQELKLFNFINSNCLFRAGCRYGKPPMLRWTGAKPIPVEADSSGQFYFNRLLLDPEMMEIVGEMFWEKCWDVWRDEGKFQIAGLEDSTPLVLAIRQAGRKFTNSILQPTHGDFNISGVYVRKEQKRYGLENWIEGILEPNVPVMLVDHATNSKGMTRKAYDVLVSLGFHVLPVGFSMIRFHNNEGTSPLEDVRYLFEKTDFAQIGDPWEYGSYEDNRVIGEDGLPVMRGIDVPSVE